LSDLYIEENHDNLYRVGLSKFIFSAFYYLKNWSVLQKKLIKKDLTFKLALNAPDWPKPCMIHFNNKKLSIFPIKVEDLDDKNTWDSLVIASARNFLEYFMGGHVILPIISMKLKVKGIFKIMKVIWFIKIAFKFFSTNQSFARASFNKMYYL